MYVLSYRRRWFKFSVLGDVKGAHLESDGIVKGRWGPSLSHHSLDPSPPPYRTDWPETFVQDFANWGRDPEDVCRFTRRFGPLTLTVDLGRQFSLRVGDWLKAQDEFRAEWKTVGHEPERKVARLTDTTTLDAVPGESFKFSFGTYTYVAANRYRFLLLELRCIARERLRFCIRPDCPNPYFVASHLKQRYCSEPCAQWGQREAKRRWWHDRGDVERRRRAAGRKKGKAKR